MVGKKWYYVPSTPSSGGSITITETFENTPLTGDLGTWTQTAGSGVARVSSLTEGSYAWEIEGTTDRFAEANIEISGLDLTGIGGKTLRVDVKSRIVEGFPLPFLLSEQMTFQVENNDLSILELDTASGNSLQTLEVTLPSSGDYTDCAIKLEYYADASEPITAFLAVDNLRTV